MFNKKCAFTLAEVLVTLGIIGVVSALTVPTLMKNHQKQVFVTQLHKVYSEMSQALELYKEDNNAVDLMEAGLTSQAALDSFMSNYFKVVKQCDSMTGCFAPSYKKLASASVTYEANSKSFITASGAAIRPRIFLSGDRISNVLVDINGQEGPNILGRDLFLMTIYKNCEIDDESTTAPLTSEKRLQLYNDGCMADNTQGYGCLGKIIEDGWQMTY